MENLVIMLIYLTFIFGFVGLAALLELLCEKIPALNRFVERIMERMEL